MKKLRIGWIIAGRRREEVGVAKVIDTIKKNGGGGSGRSSRVISPGFSASENVIPMRSMCMYGVSNSFSPGSLRLMSSNNS